MFYVYSRYISSGREGFCGVYETAKEAVTKIASFYNIDRNNNQLGEYYYFMKQH